MKEGTTVIEVFRDCNNSCFYAKTTQVAEEHTKHASFNWIFVTDSVRELALELRFFGRSVAFTEVTFRESEFAFVLAQSYDVVRATPLTDDQKEEFFVYFAKNMELDN